MANKRMTPQEAGEDTVTLEKTVLEGKEGKDPIGQVLPQLQETQQATKEQIAATNAAQADAAVAEQMQPINQTIDFLDLYNQRQAAELAREKEKEDKRIRWERLGHDIASIAASVGDMTRASEGAPVSPRDWQQTYDNLSAQARANIDNYRVRMAKIHEDEKAARMAQAQAQAKAIGDRQKQDFDIKKLMLELGWKGDQASFERALKILLNDRDNASRENVANIRANASGGGGSGIKPIRFSYNGKTVDVVGGKSFENMMNRILSVLNDKDNTKPNVKYNRVTFKPKEIQTDPQGFYNRRIIDLLSPSKFSNYTETAQSEIDKIVEDYLYKEGNGDNGGNGGDNFAGWF